MRRACQNSFSPNISDSIDNPLLTNRAARQRQKIKFEYPDFISISLSSSSLEIRRQAMQHRSAINPQSAFPATNQSHAVVWRLLSLVLVIDQLNA